MASIIDKYLERGRRAQMSSGPQFVDHRYRKRRDPHEPVTNPLPGGAMPGGESPISPETMRFLDPPRDTGYISDPGPGSLGDADSDERINVPQDPARELKDNFPTGDSKYVTYQDFKDYEDERPIHRPKKTHTVFDSQQDELILETDSDNNFTDTYPFAYAVQLSSAPVGFAMSRISILEALAAAEDNEQVLDLVKRFQGGDTAAGNELFYLYEAMVHEIIQRRTVRFDKNMYSAGEIEDIFQDAVVDFLNLIQSYDPSRAKLSTYVWNSLDGLVLNAIRSLLRNRTRKRTFREEFDPDAPGAPTPVSEDRPDPIEEFRGVDFDAILERLPEKLKPAGKWLKMNYVEGKTSREIASEVGMAHSWINQRIRDVLEWLRAQPELTANKK